MNLLSIDASLNSTGFAVFEDEKVKVKHVIEPDKKLDEVKKLKYIQGKIKKLMQSCNINEVALEDTFYGKSVGTLKKLMKVHGIVIALCNDFNIPYYYYTPNEIKKHELGDAKAGAKKRIQEKLIKEYNLPKGTKDDVTDALALGRCHLGIK